MKNDLHTPWSDTVDLVTQVSNIDTEGFDAPTETLHTVLCNWQDGVSQSEYYLSNKAVMRAAAQVEIHKADIREVWPRGTEGTRFVVFEGTRFQVIRVAVESFDTITLILSEVIR